ncbi:MAG: thioredoxin-like domain-containing protein [Geitlerinemataceae cyanobacterium]
MPPRIRAPKLPQDYAWLNTDRPLSLAELKGKFVLLDFWTYCCINCLHVLGDLKYLEQKYKKSLTVIGIHSAKFEQEKDVENIRQAILRYDIEHPILVDRDFELWQQYAVRAWPTLVLIDPEGYEVDRVSGEGKREILDERIAQLIHRYSERGTTDFRDIPLILEKQKQPSTKPLAFPGKVLADETENRLFIADTGHHRIVVTTLDGTLLHVIGNGKAGLTDGSFVQAQFSAPQGIAFDRTGQCLYVTDTDNHALRKIDLNCQTVETIAPTETQNHQLLPHAVSAWETPLNSPWDLVQIEDILLIAMAGSHQIWGMDLTDGTLGTYTGTGAEGCADGTLDDAAFAQPSGLATDGDELFVADSEISSIRAVGLAEDARVRTICGSGELFGFGDIDGRGDRVRLQHCLGVAYAAGFLWVADTYNHKIKQVDPHTQSCQTILGTGVPGIEDGIGQLASFSEPSGLSIAGDFLYIADTNNHCIRRSNLTTLTVTTLEISGLCAPDVCTIDRAQN